MPDKVLVLLHGRWYKPASMQDLAERLQLPHTACVTPAAPGRTWYPQRFMDPRAANEPKLSEAIEQVHDALDDLASRLRDDHGFELSQHFALTGRCASCA